MHARLEMRGPSTRLLRPRTCSEQPHNADSMTGTQVLQRATRQDDLCNAKGVEQAANIEGIPSNSQDPSVRRNPFSDKAPYTTTSTPKP